MRRSDPGWGISVSAVTVHINMPRDRDRNIARVELQRARVSSNGCEVRPLRRVDVTRSAKIGTRRNRDRLVTITAIQCARHGLTSIMT